MRVLAATSGTRCANMSAWPAKLDEVRTRARGGRPVMPKAIRLVFGVAFICSSWTLDGTEPKPFDRHFSDATLRVDFYHTGDAEQERITLDRLYRQGSWAGSRRHLVDRAGLGSYRVSLYDEGDGSLLYARTFDSYFGEYRTTVPASEGVSRTYHESVLVPMPLRSAIVKISVERAGAETHDLLTLTIGPDSDAISAEPPARGVTVIESTVGGAPSVTLDVAIVGEGYSESELTTFREDLERFTDVLFRHQPYDTLRSRISIRGVMKPSAESGCDEPGRGVWRDTAVGSSFGALGSPRYLLTEDNRSLRDIAANVPYDALIIMVNHSRYGGGGLYGTYCVFTAHNRWSEYLLVHEFGHSLAGLADEYYTPAVAYSDFYPGGTEPAQPNITALLDPEELKWKDLVADGTPLPTPWSKEQFEAIEFPFQQRRREFDAKIAAASRAGASEEEIRSLTEAKEQLTVEVMDQVDALLREEVFANQVGAFEGAGYAATGLYRPMADCLMFSRGARGFCKVCQRALVETVHLFTE